MVLETPQLMTNPEAPPDEKPREDPPDSLPPVEEPGPEAPEVDPPRRDPPSPAREPVRAPAPILLYESAEVHDG